LIEKLRDAIIDFRYLLSRDYQRESALKFVGDKYQLDKRERLLLYRCVYGAKDAEEHRKKVLTAREAAGSRIAVDGYNTLITVESILQGKTLILCDDCFIRDISSVHNKHQITQTTIEALKLIAKTLRDNGVEEAKLFFDAQVSRSGKLASLSRRIMGEAGVKSEAVAVKQADTEVLNWSEVVASSDAVVINRARKVFDLGGEVAKQRASEKVLKLT